MIGRWIVVILVSGFVISACSKSGGAGSLSSTTKLTSTSLGTRTSSGLNVAVHPCPTGTVTCVTPSNFSGKAIKTALRIGSGGTYISVTTATSGDLSKVTSSTTLNDFDFAAGLTFSATGSIEKEFDAGASFKDALMFFDYIDVTFTAPSFGVSTATTLRLVFANDEVLGYTMGDVLIKDGTDFKWCSTGAASLSSCSTTRPASPIVNAEVRDYAEAGSPVIPYFTTEVFSSSAGTSPVTTTFAELNGKAWTFSFDFDATDSIAVPNGTYTDVFQVMPELIIRGMSPQVNTGGQGMSAVLTATQG